MEYRELIRCRGLLMLVGTAVTNICGWTACSCGLLCGCAFAMTFGLVSS